MRGLKTERPLRRDDQRGESITCAGGQRDATIRRKTMRPLHLRNAQRHRKQDATRVWFGQVVSPPYSRFGIRLTHPGSEAVRRPSRFDGKQFDVVITQTPQPG
jgi:hypothetical protein